VNNKRGREEKKKNGKWVKSLKQREKHNKKREKWGGNKEKEWK
jgi:hypothetical protein